MARIAKPVPPDVMAAVNDALARCDREGIPLERFWSALREIHGTHPGCGYAELLRRAFGVLETQGN